MTRMESTVFPGQLAGGDAEAADGRAARALEEELWRRMSNEGDEDARDELIVSYRPLVFWLAKKFTVRPSSYQDLVQEGMMALIRAVDRFEPERGLRFTTYAFHRIRGQMINYLQRSESRAPIPVEDELLAVDDGFSPDAFDTVLAVLEEMKRLPAREEEVLKAMLIEGMEARDVARERGIDVSHVYRLRRSAIAKLRKCLGPEATNQV